MNLKEKLESFAESLTPHERAGLKLILANAVAESADENFLSEDSAEAIAYKTSVASICRLQPHKDIVPYNGVVYMGRPDFLTDNVLEVLQSEAELYRKEAVRFHSHLVVTDAPEAKKISKSKALSGLISGVTKGVVSTGKANYIYYDEAGMGIEPHIDNEDFSLNVILMLKHKHADARSALVLYPYNRDAEKIFLKPGEMIAFFADSIIHAREKMSVNEQVTISAFGFKPL
jgi:hypothetical protein